MRKHAGPCWPAARHCLSAVPVLLAFATIYLVWGSTYLGIAIAVETIPPFAAMAGRMLLAGAFLYGWARLRGEAPLTRAQWQESAVTGALLFVGGYGVIAWAEQSIASGVAALLATTSPFWLVLLQWRDGQRPALWTWAGLLLGTAGVGLLLGGDGAAASGHLLRMLGVLGGSFFWALGTLRAARRLDGGSAARMAGSEMFAGGWVLAGLALLLGEAGDLGSGSISWQSLMAVGYLTLFGSVVAFTAYRWLLSRVAPALVATHAYVNPLIALGVGWWFAQERIGGAVILSSVAIIGAIALVRLGARPPAIRMDLPVHDTVKSFAPSAVGSVTPGMRPERRAPFVVSSAHESTRASAARAPRAGSM